MQEATECSLLWTKATFDVLDHCRRTTTGSMEEIQATIIVTFLVYHLEGFSARIRSLFSSAIAMAREISLHVVDRQDASSHQRESVMSVVETEMKRRIWCFLVATDWYDLPPHVQ